MTDLSNTKSSLSIDLNLKNNSVKEFLTQGVAAQKAKDWGKAKTFFRKALEIEPDNFDTLYLLGSLESKNQNYQVAEILFSKALAINPESAEALYRLGMIFYQVKNTKKAIAHFQKSIQLNPKLTDAYNYLGTIHLELKEYKQALNYFSELTKLAPNRPEGFNNCGFALHKLKHYEKACACFTQALKIQPQYIDALNNLGMSLAAQNKHADAAEVYKRVIHQQPEYIVAYNNLGNSLQRLNLMKEAVESYKKAIQLNPKYAGAYNNLGHALKELGDIELAKAHYKRAMLLEPLKTDGYFYHGLCDLLTGHYDEGWLSYEFRWHIDSISEMAGKRKFTTPLWLGEESLTGKTILIYGEQGLGDILQFCRYAKLVANLGATVIVQAPSSLLPILRSVEGVHQAIGKTDPIPKIDYQCPVLSLPLAFQTTLDTIPAPAHYITAQPSKIEEWKDRLNGNGKKLVGVVWSGNSSFTGDFKRSLTLEQFILALPIDPSVQYVCLQQELREADKKTIARYPHLAFFGNQIKDFSDTAALVSLMDVVISSCTSVAHLSGAMGQKTWVLLSYVPDWRWLLHRSDSPWYPSATLYRQEKLGEWRDPLNKINSDLKALFH